MSSTTAAAVACITATPDKNGHVPLEDCRALWPYYPSIAAAALIAAIFGISTFTHIIQAIHYRMRFCWVIIMAGSWETAGFLFRALSAHNQTSLGLYLPGELFILLSPIWINAFDYMLLGRMVYYFLPEQKIFRLHATKFALLFVSLDIVAFLIQLIGGTMASGRHPEKLETGLHIYMTGIALQQAFILFFLSFAISFHRRMLKLECEGVLDQKNKRPWRPLLYTLYASLALITTRIIFRLVEYSAGVSSPIPTHEAFFYSLEAFPMVLALFIMNITHPGRTFVGPDADFPKKTRQQKEEKEAKKEAKQAERERREMRNFGLGSSV